MKKMLAMLLTSAIAVTTIAACAAPAAGTTAPAAPAETETVAEAETPEAEAPEAEAPEETAVAPEDIVEINVVLTDIPGVADNAKEIEKRLNEITEASIGVRANFTWLPFGEYGKSLGLLLAGGEHIDIASQVPRDPATLPALYARGQLREISEVLEEYAPEMLETIGDKWLDAYRIDGGLYGVPTYRNYGSSVYVIMRKDILDELGLTEKAQNMTTWAEVEEIYQAVSDNTNLAPVGGQKTLLTPGGILAGDNFEDAIAFDTLSDNIYVVYTDNDGNVSLLAENEQQKEMLDRYRRWWDAGYIYKDSPVTVDHVDMTTKAGVLFSTIQVSEIGVEVAKENTTGYPMVATKVMKNVLGSTFVAKFGTVMPITGDEPEAAAKWLNELYTNVEMMNLLDWGEEGIDYQIVNGEATFMPGEDVNTVRFHNKDYVTGNFFLALPWEGQGADFRQVALDDLNTYEASPYLGFTPDLSELDNAIAALNSVYEEYYPSIFTGSFDDERYEKYISSMKTAGSDDYIKAFQEQIDAWKATR